MNLNTYYISSKTRLHCHTIRTCEMNYYPYYQPYLPRYGYGHPSASTNQPPEPIDPGFSMPHQPTMGSMMQGSAYPNFGGQHPVMDLSMKPGMHGNFPIPDNRHGSSWW
ncbi:hypothetical protein ACOME3_004539 [Neoechinorhynchus agilis]